MSHTPAAVSAVLLDAAWRVQISDDLGHQWLADEPQDAGGGNTATTPDRMVLGALGACTAITLRMYAQRKGWPLEGVTVDLQLNPQLEGERPAPGAGNDITRTIRLQGPLDDTQRVRLLEIADACPVHRLLTGEVRVSTVEKAD